MALSAATHTAQPSAIPGRTRHAHTTSLTFLRHFFQHRFQVIDIDIQYFGAPA
jgi:hypothetical protein